MASTIPFVSVKRLFNCGFSFPLKKKRNEKQTNKQAEQQLTEGIALIACLAQRVLPPHFFLFFILSGKFPLKNKSNCDAFLLAKEERFSNVYFFVLTNREKDSQECVTEMFF